MPSLSQMKLVLLYWKLGTLVELFSLRPADISVFICLNNYMVYILIIHLLSPWFHPFASGGARFKPSQVSFEISHLASFFPFPFSFVLPLICSPTSWIVSKLFLFIRCHILSHSHLPLDVSIMQEQGAFALCFTGASFHLPLWLCKQAPIFNLENTLPTPNFIYLFLSAFFLVGFTPSLYETLSYSSLWKVHWWVVVYVCPYFMDKCIYI